VGNKGLVLIFTASVPGPARLDDAASSDLRFRVVVAERRRIFGLGLLVLLRQSLVEIEHSVDGRRLLVVLLAAAFVGVLLQAVG